MNPNQATSIKNRFREAVVARKKADKATVESRGKEILAAIRKNAKKDLEALEAEFLSHNDVTPIIKKIETFAATDADADADI